MTHAPRLRRSVLFVPAANARALAKSETLAADGLIYDLEDSAALQEKDAARERLRDHLATSAFEGERIVRINPLESAHGTEDFLMARGAGVDAILVPKVETVAGLQQVADALAETDAPPSLQLWAMIETPRAILAVAELVAAAPRCRLAALVVGSNDIAFKTGVEPGPDRAELLPWLMRIILAAKAHGVAVLDSVYADFRDPAGLAAECAAGRRMGFDGKTLIHPAQIAAANGAFAPSPEAVARAEGVVSAFADPANAGKGVIQIEGRMVERLHLDQARQLLALRAAIAAAEARRTEG